MSSEVKDTKTSNPLRVAITTKPPVYLTADRARELIAMITGDVISKAQHYDLALPQLKSSPVLCNGVIITEFYDNLSLDALKYNLGYVRKIYNGCQPPPKKQIIFSDVSFHDLAFISDFDPVNCVNCSLRIEYRASGWTIHEILIKQNNDYQMDQWYYCDAIKNEDSSVVTITYYVPEQLLVKVQNTNCQVTFGFQTVELQIIDPGTVHLVGGGHTA